MRYVTCALAGASALILASCGDDPATETADVVRPAKLYLVESATDIQTLRLPAVIDASATSLLTFQVSGLLQELPITEGQEVVQGELLAQLDQRKFKNAVDSAQAEYENAQRQFERAEQLIDNGNIARSVYDERRSAVNVTRASLDTAQKNLEDSVLHAPFDGVIANIEVDAFETVAAQQPILTIQNTDLAEAVVEIPTSVIVNADRIEPLEAHVRLDVAPDVQIDAEFSEAAALGDASAQTFEVKFAFDPPDQLTILPGMTGILLARFRLTGDDTATTDVSIPIDSVVSEGGETAVWIVDETDMTVSRRVIQAELGADDRLDVTAGLAAGDVIVAAGAPYLREGQKIRRYDATDQPQ